MKKKFLIDSEEVSVDITLASDHITVLFEGGESFSFSKFSERPFLLQGENERWRLGTANIDVDSVQVQAGEVEAILEEVSTRRKKSAQSKDGMKAPMPGKVFKILKSEGSQVQRGDAVLILEAMKMEHTIKADKDGFIKAINFAEGEMVQGGVVLATIDEGEE